MEHSEKRGVLWRKPIEVTPRAGAADGSREAEDAGDLLVGERLLAFGNEREGAMLEEEVLQETLGGSDAPRQRHSVDAQSGVRAANVLRHLQDAVRERRAHHVLLVGHALLHERYESSPPRRLELRFVVVEATHVGAQGRGVLKLAVRYPV